MDGGVGTGQNIQFYPEGSRVIGIDNSPEMIGMARKRCAKLGKNVELLEMDVLETAFPDRHFDLIVATFLFTVLPEHQHLPALKELARVCRPNGQIRLLDCTYSHDPLLRFTMRLWAPWAKWTFAAAFDRHPEIYMPQAGLKIIDERFVFRDTIKLIVAQPLPRRV